MYVEGFVVPVKTAAKADYTHAIGALSALYIEYGAARAVENWAVDAPVGDLTSFPRAVVLEEDETVVFAWIEYADKATRDRVHEQVWSDPRIEEMTVLREVVAGKRMIIGGFETIQDMR